MADETIKAAITDVSYEDHYNDDGIKTRKYTFKIDGKKLTCHIHRLEHLSEGDTMIVKVRKENNAYVMVAGLHTARGYKWGKISELKTLKGEADNFSFMRGKIIEKRKSNPGAVNLSRTNFTIVLENGNFYVSGYIGVKLKRDDEVSAVIEDQFAIIVYNETTGKKYGVKGPYYLVFIFLFICFNILMYYLISTGNKVVVNPKGVTLVFDFFFAFFGIPQYIVYRRSNAARRFIATKMAGKG